MGRAVGSLLRQGSHSHTDTHTQTNTKRNRIASEGAQGDEHTCAHTKIKNKVYNTYTKELELVIINIGIYPSDLPLPWPPTGQGPWEGQFVEGDIALLHIFNACRRLTLNFDWYMNNS